MDSLTSNEKSFVKLMQNVELRRKGFELLSKSPRCLLFFDELKRNEFFHPQENPSPKEIAPNRFQVPYWPALDYLHACAERVRETQDIELAEKIMSIIRDVTANSSGGSRDNHNTFYRFAQIIGVLPTASVKFNDLKMVRIWLNTKLDRTMVLATLLSGAFERFLDSPDTADWSKALSLMDYCTEQRRNSTEQEDQAGGEVDDESGYWSGEIVKRHASRLGERCGGRAAELFRGRVAEVFGRGARATASHTFRPAVEDDPQNDVGYRSFDSCLVAGLRDILLAWDGEDGAARKDFVAALLRSDNQMLTRIGIFALSQRWEELKDIYLPVVRPEFFDLGHLHELYGLLRDTFEAFSDQDKKATVKAIQEITVEPADFREYVQLLWVSAFAGTSYGSVARWFEELNRKQGPLQPHPDYPAYFDSRWGHGQAEYKAYELIKFAKSGTIHEKLARATTRTSLGTWEEPTVEALVDELEMAVADAPWHFVGSLQGFLNARREFLYALLSGLLKPWRTPKDRADLSGFNKVWDPLLDLFENLLNDRGFWDSGDPTWKRVKPFWIKPPVIADAIARLLYHGNRDDKLAYPASLLPRSWSLIQILLDRNTGVSEPSDDPMRQSINSSRGHALEAALSHILRRCRMADSENDLHTKVFLEVREFMDRELEKCVGANFEFSTLCGSQIVNLQYIDNQWLGDNIGRIFSIEHRRNITCALAGLAYTSLTRSIYMMLRDAKVIENALRIDLDVADARKGLMRALIMGYLNGEDSLDGPRFTILFDSYRDGYFEEINMHIREISPASLNPEQVDRVVGYWRRCVKWASQQEKPPADLMTGLGYLTSFLTSVSDEDVPPLFDIMPYVSVYRFIGEMDRWVAKSPGIVCRVLNKLVDTKRLDYDPTRKMPELVKKIDVYGFHREAIEFCDKLRSVPGMQNLYAELTER